MPHFIYCGDYYSWGRREKLKEIILTKMREYGIQSSILTMLNMKRIKLVTKETVKKAYKGKLKDDIDWKDYEESINDDLEKYLIKLQNPEEVNYEEVSSFFTPKLTNGELKLVQEKNEKHLSKYMYPYPDVGVQEMKQSDSKSKYVHGHCFRVTIPLTTEYKTKDEVQVSKRKMHV